MSDGWTFFLVLAALYALECIAAIPRHAVWLTGSRGHGRATGANSAFGSKRYALMIADVGRPLRASFLVPLAPISLGREGAVAFAAHAWLPGARPESTGRFLSFDAPFDLRARDGTLDVGGREFVRLGSTRAAERWAEWIRRVGSARPDTRASLIARIADEHLSYSEARRRLDAFDAATAVLGIAGGLLALFLLVAIPAVIVWRGLPASWLGLLAVLLALHVTVVTLAWRARARLRRDGIEIAATRLIPVALSPVSASRAIDALGRDLVADLHPLAAAKVLCAEAEFEGLADGVLRDLRHPMRPMPDLPLTAAETEAAFRDVLTQKIEHLAAARPRREPQAKAAAPKGSGTAARCPRCGVRYAGSVAACADCGLPLEVSAP
jgi:hypothetical protein